MTNGMAGVFVELWACGWAECCGWALPQPRSIAAGGRAEREAATGVVVAKACRHPESPLHCGCGMIGFHHGAALGTAQVENAIFIGYVKLY